ncbi:hypothetical protein ACHAW5_001208 [Stephanodiscus triporus]|uniref:Glycosyltransferase 2-like domain-containing protein n=1 Tax=Stephanodiscus triporus TaxID=2934178 RepID=A0ABD3N2X7_9STRA
MAELSGEYIYSRTRVVTVTVTYYPDIHDVRFQLALELCRLASRHKITLFIVDDSPDATVRENLQRGSEYVHVFQQDRDQYAGKGGALRQAIKMAKSRLDEDNNFPHEAGASFVDTAICFTEPEKVDLMNHIHAIVGPILAGTADVTVPSRNDELFRETYPTEQYHSESFGNMHFDLLAKHFEGFRRDGARKLDWLFGPFALHSRLAGSWLSYDGNSWDAQMVPYVRGVRTHNWRITSVPVNFRHPKEMKEQEEGDPVWTTKRLKQLNVLFDLLGAKELSVSD